MKKSLMVLLMLLFIAGFLLTPVISSAVPGNGNGNGYVNGNGNHNGWCKVTDIGNPTSVPEPTTLLLLMSGIVGLVAWVAIRKTMM